MGYILVLDDDPTIGRLVSTFLRFEGFTVKSETEGAKSLALLALEQPILIILDLQMPIMDGPTFHGEALRAGYSGPFIILSGSVGARAIQRQLGAGAYLSKPFDPDLLTDTVHQLLVA